MDSTKQHPLQGYFLTRAYRGENAFVSVMDLMREEAVRLCEKIRGRRHASQASGQKGYLDSRQEVEEWLRGTAGAAGVDIRRQNPVYFALTAGRQEAEPGGVCSVISIPVEEIDTGACSFTWGDSFLTHGEYITSAQKTFAQTLPAPGRVMDARGIVPLIEEHGIPGCYLGGGKLYIEAQLWDVPPNGASLQERFTSRAAAISPSPAPRTKNPPSARQSSSLTR